MFDLVLLLLKFCSFVLLRRSRVFNTLRTSQRWLLNNVLEGHEFRSWWKCSSVELLHFLLFLSTPSSLPPSLCWNKVPPGFLALKGQKQTEQWLLELRLQEEGPQGRKKSEGRVGAGKVLCGTFFKPKLTTEDEMFIWGSRKMRTWGLRLRKKWRRTEVRTTSSTELHPSVPMIAVFAHTPRYDITICRLFKYLHVCWGSAPDAIPQSESNSNMSSTPHPSPPCADRKWC